MVIASQIVSVIILLLSRIQKTKANTLICILLFNIASIVSLVLLNQVAGTFLTVATIFRTIIFFLYYQFKIKPNIYVLLTYEPCFLTIGIVTWNCVIDILILLDIVLFTYVSWQDNMSIVRIGMVAEAVILSTYYILIGAYINIIGEVVCLIAAFVAIVYYDIYKRTTPIVKRILYYVKPKRKRKKLKARLKRRTTKA